MIGTEQGKLAIKYRGDLDGMRAVAVLMVLIFHFDLAWKGKAGFLGVDIFYVISGFLITTIIKKQLDENIFSLKKFYIGRIRRLAPALFTVLLLTMAAGSLWLFPKDFYELSKQVFASQTYIANFYFWKNTNYFGLNANNVFLLHTWSLAVEEQFYLIYPIFLLLIHKYLRNYFWPAVIIVLFLSFALNIIFFRGYPEASFYLLPTRAWELLLGGIIPFVHEKYSRTRKTDELIGLTGVCLIIVAVASYNEEIRMPGVFVLLPTLGAACLILSGTESKTTTANILGNPLAIYIGKISYSLYLVHWPINVYAKTLLNEGYNISWHLGMFALSFALAIPIYHLIENPVRQQRILTADGRLAKIYISGLCVTALVFLLIKTSDGLPARFPDEVSRIASYASDKTPPLPQCEFKENTRLNASNFCKIGSGKKEPDWIIYGDSHAWAGYEAFDKWLKLKGASGYFIFRHACPPVSGIHLFKDKGKCLDFNQEVYDFLKHNKTVKNVYLVSSWHQAIEGKVSDSPERKLEEKESTKLFQKQFSATLQLYRNLGLNTYIWEPVPGARKDVPVALARAVMANQQADIEIGLDEYLKVNAFFFSVIESNRYLIKSSFSPSKALCSSGSCAVTIDGNPAYFDNNHITRSSSAFWAAKMQENE